MAKKLTFFFVLAFFALCCIAQQEGMEYVIKDTPTLREYILKTTVLKSGTNSATLAKTYKRIGDYYYKTDTRDSTMHYYKQALQQYEIIKDSFYISYCSLRIAEESRLGNDLQASLSWSLPAAAWFERNGKMNMAAHANLTISDTYSLMNDMPLRQHYLNKSIELNKSLKDTLLGLVILLNQSNDLLKEKNWGAVYALSQQMVNMSRAFKQHVFLNNGLLVAGKSLLSMGRPDKAIPPLKESVAIKAIANLKNITKAYELLTRCYMQLGNTVEAEKYFDLYGQSIDSNTRKREKDNYEELMMKYKTEKTENAITLLEKDNKIKASTAKGQRWLIIILATGLFLLMLGGYIFFQNSHKRKKLEQQLHLQQENFTLKLQKEKEEKITADFNKQLAEVQLTALSAQMNPHFIFNCMNSIQKYVLKNEKEKALDFLQNFSDLMRIVLDNSVKPKVQLDEEIKMLDKYILLERQRLDNRFNYHIDIDKTLQTDFFEIPGMLIQPYVENAIWHGLMNLSEADKQGLLIVAFSKEENFIQCVITDNGVGRAKAAELTKSKSPGHKSYGMAISQKRLQLLKMDNEKLPKEQIEDLYKNGEPCGTRVTLNIYIT
jgi:hypothetical protein